MITSLTDLAELLRGLDVPPDEAVGMFVGVGGEGSGRLFYAVPDVAGGEAVE